MEIDWSREARDAGAEFEVLQRQKKRREAKPLFYCKFVAHYPVPAFLINLFLLIAMYATTGILVFTGYDILPIYFDDLPLRITHEPWDAKRYAWNGRDMYPDRYERGGSATKLFRTTYSRKASVSMIFIAKNGENIFSKEAFKEMQKLEADFTTMKDYDKYCLLNPVTSACVKPNSILRYFDGTYAHVNSVFNDTEFNNITDVIYEAFTNNATKSLFRGFICEDNVVTSTDARCSITRATLSFGEPLEGFSTEEEFQQQSQKYANDVLAPFLEKRMSEASAYEFVFRSQFLWSAAATEQAFKDMMLVGGSIGFIFCLVLFHTRSLWIAGFAILSICGSFMTGNLIYNLIYGYKYLGFFHVLALFIVLGIGADDVFVFYDIWRNSDTEEYPSLAHRLSDVYRRSALSMFFTSLTTTVAFLSSAIIPLLATRSFGLFSATVVIVLYISVIVYLPTVIIMYHIYFEDTQWPCFEMCRRLKKKCKRQPSGHGSSLENERKSREHRLSNGTASDRGNDKVINPVYDTSTGEGLNWQMKALQASTLHIKRPAYIENVNNGKIARGRGDLRHNTNNRSGQNGHLPSSSYSQGFDNQTFTHNADERVYSRHIPNTDQSNQHIDPRRNSQDNVKLKKRKKSFAVRFFRNYYFRFVTHPVIRWVIVAVISGLLAFMVYQASRLDVYADEPLAVFPEDHHFPRTMAYMTNGFVKSEKDEAITVYLAFGMGDNDMDTCPFSTPVCQGDRRWDPNFNPNTVQAQTALMGVCQALRDVTPETNVDMRMRTDVVTGAYAVDCFTEKLNDFLQDESTGTGKNWSLPFGRDQMLDFVADKPQFYNITVLNQTDFENFLEIPISYWLFNSYSGTLSPDFALYDPLIGEQLGPHSTPVTGNNNTRYGNKIRYLAIKVDLDVNFRTTSFAAGVPIRTKWEDFFTQQIAKMPAGLQEGFQTAVPEIWSFWTTQAMVVDNAVYGIAIGLSLACPILIIATGNIVTGLLATFCLCCCTACVIGVIPLGGWELGFLEALNLCMVVGLAVDYVVHLAEGYTHSLHNDRLSRVQDMLDEMAVSVFFGACTTLGAAAVMFFTKLSFFQQFAIFMFSTLGFSFVFSMGLFVTLLGIIGPQNDTGDFIALIRRCRNKPRKQARK